MKNLFKALLSNIDFQKLIVILLSLNLIATGTIIFYLSPKLENLILNADTLDNLYLQNDINEAIGEINDNERQLAEIEDQIEDIEWAVLEIHGVLLE